MNNQFLKTASLRCEDLGAPARARLVASSFLLALAFLVPGCGGQKGTVRNSENNEPIVGASVYHDGQITRSDAAGSFKFEKFNIEKPIQV
jgi:hypothetical protein